MRPNLFAGILSFGLIVAQPLAMAQATAPLAAPHGNPFLQQGPQAAPSTPAAPTDSKAEARRLMALPPNKQYPDKDHLIMPGVCFLTPEEMFGFLHDERGMKLAVAGATTVGDGAGAVAYNDDMEWVFLAGSPRGICIIADGVHLAPVPASPPAAPGDDDGDQGDGRQQPQAYHPKPMPGCAKRPQGCPETEEHLMERQQSYRDMASF